MRKKFIAGKAVMSTGKLFSQRILPFLSIKTPFPVFEFESLEPPTGGAERMPVIAANAGTQVP
jgi:hypothetical protein